MAAMRAACDRRTMPAASRQTANVGPPERVGQVLREAGRQVERDRVARRVEVGNLDVEQHEQQDRSRPPGAPATRAAAARSRRRSSRTASPRPASTPAHVEVGVEVPVEDAHLASRVVHEHLGVQREADEDDRQQRQRPPEQPAVRNPPEQPRQRRALERPADRHPLLVQLQRDGDRDEGQHGRGHERQPPERALGRRLEPEQRGQQDAHQRGLHHRQRADHASVPGRHEGQPRHVEEPRAGDDRREVRREAPADPPSERERVAEEDQVEGQARASACRSSAPGAACAACQSTALAPARPAASTAQFEPPARRSQAEHADEEQRVERRQRGRARRAARHRRDQHQHLRRGPARRPSPRGTGFGARRPSRDRRASTRRADRDGRDARLRRTGRRAATERPGWRASR